MSRFQLLCFVSIFSLAVFNSCSKDDDTPPTSIKVTVLDGLGNAVSGASVKLFTSDEDLLNNTNQVGATKSTNSSGEALFEDLLTIHYYALAEKGCLSNIYSGVVTSDPLSENKINTFSVILGEIGSIDFYNNSSNPYRVFVNGEHAFDLSGNTRRVVDNIEAGSYSVSVIQISGYLFTTTQRTYTGVLVCGGTLGVTFPF